MGGQFHTVFRAGLLIATVASLAACEAAGLSTPSIPGVSSLFEAKEGPPLQGKRVSVLSSESAESATASVESKEPVSLPGVQANSSWSQPGGVASNAPGHLAFEARPSRHGAAMPERDRVPTAV